MIKNIIILTFIIIAASLYFIYSGGGTHIKDAAVKTYKVGEELEHLGKQMKKEGKKMEKEINKIKKVIEGK